jgi:hypothetical protein
MTGKVRHTHAGFLAEAIQDTSRRIEGKHNYKDCWEEVDLSFVARADQRWDFRFVDTVKPKIVSTLSDEELYSIVDKHNPYSEDVNYSIIRAVANAAAEKHDVDMHKKFGFRYARTLNNIV